MDNEKFDEWIEVKKKLHANNRLPRILEGEVWWCSLGQNVGVEINGKSARFTRPVLIMKKLSALCFMGIPLTSQKHEGSWWVEFEFLGKKEYAAVCQARMISVSRLHGKMGRVPDSDLLLVKNGFQKIFE